MRASKVLAAAAALGLSLACSGSTAPPVSPDQIDDAPNDAAADDPAYRADIKLICDVDRLAQTEDLEPLEAEARRDDYLAEHVKQPDAIYFLTILRSKPWEERGELLLREARKSRVDCPLGAQMAEEAQIRPDGSSAKAP